MDSKCSAGVLAVIAMGAAGAAQAGSGDWVVRGRAMYLDFDNGQNSLPVAVEAGSRAIPEVDFVHYFTDRWSAELVLTYPQSVDIDVGGARAGSVKALPPTLLAQYHFTGMGAFKPYLGAGVNLALFSSRNHILGGAARVDSSSTGLALGRVSTIR